nr:MAG TPA: repressor domain protein [Caudoviricetes sp.]
MRNELTIFKNSEFGEIRTIIDDKNDVWFCLKDVCDVLGLSNPSQVLEKLDVEERAKFNIGRQGEANFTNESGLYTVILRSDKPNAKPFRKWVTSDVLPSIRKTGMYLTDNVFDMMMRNPEKIGEMLIEYGRTRKENEQLKLDNKIKEQQITELQPKAEYTDVILQCKDLVSMTVIAKDYGKSAIFMNELLHKLGVQYKESGVWFLYQKYAECGYTRTKTFAVGDNNAKTHTYWTQKGRLFIYNLLKENGYLPIMEDRDYE